MKTNTEKKVKKLCDYIVSDYGGYYAQIMDLAYDVHEELNNSETSKKNHSEKKLDHDVHLTW